MTVMTVKTVILILERIQMMARNKNYIISHMIGMILFQVLNSSKLDSHGVCTKCLQM